MCTSSYADASDDTEYSQPCDDTSVTKAGRGDDEQERAEDREDEFFAVDFVSAQCISEETKSQLADDHTNLPSCVRPCRIYIDGSRGELTERQPLMTSLGTVGTASFSVAKYR